MLDLCRDVPTAVDGYKPNGSFVQQKRNGGDLYWYYRGYERSMDGSRGTATLKYVGPVGDPVIGGIVSEHGRLKARYKQRRDLASRLRRAGLPSPHQTEGAVTAILLDHGVLSAGSTLVGSAAFQTYGGLLGVRLDESQFRTFDIDVAQPASLRIDPGPAMAVDLLAALRKGDATFDVLHHADEPALIAGYVNAENFRVEFLTPMRAERRSTGRLASVAGLPGVGAQTLKYLEFVLKDPVESVMLHDAGLLVPVPEPGRYAVHKLMVAANRADQGPRGRNVSKALKDVRQATSIIAGLAHARMLAMIGAAWLEAWHRGPSWKRLLRLGTLRLDLDHLATLGDAVDEAAAMEGVVSPFSHARDPREALLAGSHRKRQVPKAPEG